MARAVVAAALCLVLASVPASASFLQDTLQPVAGDAALMQHDGGSHGDAPATCAEVDASRTVSVGDSGKEGMLLEKDDESDAYAYDINGSLVGERVFLALDLGVLNDRYDVAYEIFGPGCGTSVLEEGSAYYDPAPADPYAPQDGATVTEAEPTAYDCAASWTFQADGMLGFDPAADLYVEWSNGDYAFVPLTSVADTYTVVSNDDDDHREKRGLGHRDGDHKHDGRHGADEEPVLVAQAALYGSTLNGGITVSRMAIQMPDAWTGSLTIASGPCDAVASSPPAAPMALSSYAEFTVQEQGIHVIVIWIERSTEDKTVDTANDLVANPPTSVPVYCHDVCTMALQFTSYDMSSAVAA